MNVALLVSLKYTLFYEDLIKNLKIISIKKYDLCLKNGLDLFVHISNPSKKMIFFHFSENLLMVLLFAFTKVADKLSRFYFRVRRSAKKAFSVIDKACKSQQEVMKPAPSEEGTVFDF